MCNVCRTLTLTLTLIPTLTLTLNPTLTPTLTLTPNRDQGRDGRRYRGSALSHGLHVSEAAGRRGSSSPRYTLALTRTPTS